RARLRRMTSRREATSESGPRSRSVLRSTPRGCSVGSTCPSARASAKRLVSATTAEDSMNNRALTLSVLMAIIAVFFVQSYVESIEKEAEKKYGANIIVVAAKEDIREMSTIDETMIGLKTIP